MFVFCKEKKTVFKKNLWSTWPVEQEVVITFSLLQLLRLLGLLSNECGLMRERLTDQSISSRICGCEQVHDRKR